MTVYNNRNSIAEPSNQSLEAIFFLFANQIHSDILIKSVTNRGNKAVLQEIASVHQHPQGRMVELTGGCFQGFFLHQMTVG